MGNIEDFQRQFTSVMENLLHLAVTETTKLFESAVQELKAEHAWIQKQNDKDTLCSYQRSIPEWSGNPCTRDIGVQVRVTPMVVERSCSPGSQHEDTDKTRFSGSFPGILQDENQQFTLLFIKPEEADMYDYTPACLLPKLAEDCPKPFLVQHIEASVMSQEAGVLPVRPSPYQGMPDNATSPFTHNPTSSIPQAVQECALPAPVETPQSQELNPSDYFHASLELMTDTQKEKYVRLLQPPTPTPTSSLTDAADGSISATKDVAKLSYQGQPRRLSARKSKSVYRPLVDLETPQHDGENIQHANATSASTFHVPTKVRKKTGKKSYNWPSRNQPGKNEQLKSQLGRSHRNEYKCEVCERVLSSASHLKRHWKVHSVMRDSVCSKCGKVFPTERSLSGHMLIHTSDSCYQRLEDVATVETEQADDEIDQQSLGFPSDHFHATLELMTDTQKEKYVRLLQPPTPTLTSSLTDAADGSVSATKDVAKLSYQGQPRRLMPRKSKSIYRHLVDLDTPKPNAENILQENDTNASTCYVPTKVCKETTNKSSKQPSKNRPGKHQCEVCGRVLSSASSLEHHQRVHRERPFVCDVCGKTFPDRSGLRCHLRIHTAAKHHQCLECGKTFNFFSVLTRHKITHTGEGPFSCSLCGKRFLSEMSKGTHMRTHGVEKPHICTLCGKGFSLLGTLWRHKRTHTGEKPYSCLTCGSRFKDRSSLREHKRIHTGEKPYQCKICGKKFRLSSGLRYHVSKGPCQETLGLITGLSHSTGK